MAITILPPIPVVSDSRYDSSQSEDDHYDEDVDMGVGGGDEARPAKRAKLGREIVTPGEIVTDDPQWMRWA